MRTGFWRFLVCIIPAAFVVVSGCSPKYNHALMQKNLQSLGTIKVVRHETPGILKASGTETGLLALVTIAAPGGSALLVLGDAYGKARGAVTQSMVPDFGHAVMTGFVEGASRSAPDWPVLHIVYDPLNDQSGGEFNERSAVIEFDVKRLAYGSVDLTRGGVVLERGLDKGVIVDGFLSKTVVTLKDPQGEVLWQKGYLYLSKDYGREKSLAELEADNWNLLKEEMAFAAEKTVEDFLSHLNGAVLN